MLLCCLFMLRVFSLRHPCLPLKVLSLISAVFASPPPTSGAFSFLEELFLIHHIPQSERGAQKQTPIPLSFHSLTSLGPLLRHQRLISAHKAPTVSCDPLFFPPHLCSPFSPSPPPPEAAKHEVGRRGHLSCAYTPTCFFFFYLHTPLLLYPLFIPVVLFVNSQFMQWSCSFTFFQLSCHPLLL